MPRHDRFISPLRGLWVLSSSFSIIITTLRVYRIQPLIRITHWQSCPKFIELKTMSNWLTKGKVISHWKEEKGKGKKKQSVAVTFCRRNHNINFSLFFFLYPKRHKPSIMLDLCFLFFHGFTAILFQSAADSLYLNGNPRNNNPYIMYIYQTKSGRF